MLLKDKGVASEQASELGSGVEHLQSTHGALGYRPRTKGKRREPMATD